VRTISRIIVGVYFLGAVISALLMKSAIPALNPFGMAYVGLSWPAAVVGVNVVPEPGPFADMMFTFGSK
jgi:hypothetical protein